MKTWDIPTRLFKWSFVALIFAAPLTKWYGNSSFLAHRIIGYCILALILWRVLWGFFGGELSRFSHFFPTPLRVFTYLKNPYTTLGHNPLGSLMILALLGGVFIQASLGLFSSDEISIDGPLAHLLPNLMGFATKYHHKIFWWLCGLVSIHTLVNLYYQFIKKEKLISSIILGKTETQEGVEPAQGSLRLALLLLVFSFALVFGGLYVFGRSAFV